MQLTGGTASAAVVVQPRQAAAMLLTEHRAVRSSAHPCRRQRGGAPCRTAPPPRCRARTAWPWPRCTPLADPWRVRMGLGQGMHAQPLRLLPHRAAWVSHAALSHAMPCFPTNLVDLHGMPCALAFHAMPSGCVSCHAMPSMPCHATRLMLKHAMPRHAMPCHSDAVLDHALCLQRRWWPATAARSSAGR